MTKYVTTPPRYVRHPPASSSELRDGAPLDAESAMIVHSNLTFLGERKRRIIGASEGGGPFIGYVSGAVKSSTPWSGYLESEPQSPQVYNRIPWDLRTCVMFGPEAIVARSFSVSPPGYLLSKIAVEVHGWGGAGAGAGKKFRVMAALTLGPEAPIEGSSSVLAQDYYGRDNLANGEFRETILLDPQIPVRPSTDWLCRPNATVKNTVRVPACYVWIGWDSTNTNPAIVEGTFGITAYEVWE